MFLGGQFQFRVQRSVQKCPFFRTGFLAQYLDRSTVWGRIESESESESGRPVAHISFSCFVLWTNFLLLCKFLTVTCYADTVLREVDSFFQGSTKKYYGHSCHVIFLSFTSHLLYIFIMRVPNSQFICKSVLHLCCLTKQHH